MNIRFLQGLCLAIAATCVCGVAEAATSLVPFVQFSIRDQDPEDGIADI